MSNMILCNAPPSKSCPEPFQLAVSNWIDASNVGDVGPRRPPPAGLRLRWNCPFLSQPRAVFPSAFEVQRSAPLDAESMFIPDPTVGHLPRITAPKQFWKRLHRSSLTVFDAGPGDCDHVQAVYLTLGARASQVSVSLIGTDGRTTALAEVGANDRLYIEIPDLHSVVLSSATDVTEAIGLDLATREIPIEFSTIARINARHWINSSLAGVAPRLTGASGPYVRMRPAEWDELAAKGSRVIAALDAGNTPDPADLASVQVYAANLWETSVLIGLGFIDGEHPANPAPDQIIAGSMLQAPSNDVFAYRVLASLPGGRGRDSASSTIYFASAELMKPLSPGKCGAVGTPSTRLERTNFVSQGPKLDQPRRVAKAKEQTICDSNWEIISGPSAVDQIITAPRATDSAITGDVFVDVGEFSSDGQNEPIRYRGRARIDRRRHNFKVPFFDSDVWLNYTVADLWDRRLKPVGTHPVQPLIKYDGLCIPIKDAACHPAVSPAIPSVKVQLDEKSDWKADALAAYAGGEIGILMRRFEIEAVVADARIGPAFASGGGDWSATVTTELTETQLSYLIGGTLVVGPMTALIRGFGPLARGQVLCTFQQDAHCAGAKLYDVDANGAKATLSEATDSERLWVELARINVLQTGLPDRYSVEGQLPEFESSTVLSFSTRVILNFEGQALRGPLTTPVSAPYICPAPKRPDLCFDIRQLGTDYYGRAMVRAKPLGCDTFSARYDAAISVAPGVITTDSDFAIKRANGILGQQAPFDQIAIFEAFETLETVSEHASYTIGLEYVRAQDTRASPPQLRAVTKRRVGN